VSSIAGERTSPELGFQAYERIREREEIGKWRWTPRVSGGGGQPFIDITGDGADLGAVELPRLDSELLPRSEVEDDVFIWWVPPVSSLPFRYAGLGFGGLASWAG
jgi:hypothetical protein